MITEKEFRERYDCFKRGFITGASGKNPLSDAGTPEPPYRREYDLGFEKGRAAFVNALSMRLDQLKQYGVSKTITESEFMEIYAPQAQEWQDIAKELASRVSDETPSAYDVTVEQRRRAAREGRLLINYGDFNIVPDLYRGSVKS